MPALSARPCRRACAARTQFPEGGGSSVRLTDPVRDETGIPKRVTPGLEIFFILSRAQTRATWPAMGREHGGDLSSWTSILVVAGPAILQCGALHAGHHPTPACLLVAR